MNPPLIYEQFENRFFERSEFNRTILENDRVRVWLRDAYLDGESIEATTNLVRDFFWLEYNE